MIKTRFKPPTTNHEPRTNPGSALILTVVLTSLLAIVGVLFLLVSRLDKIATSGLSENKELNYAVETVIAKISQDLALDIPRTDANGIVLSEYYDYPGPADKWLACLEPSTDPNRWRQISDVTGYLAYRGWSNQNIAITTQASGLFKPIIEDHKTIALDPNGGLMEQLADADGDGIADSKWIELTDITSNKGKPIYAAVRVIDNDGMLNVNTAYKFNPNETDPNLIDGSSQMQINLMALAGRPGTTPTLAEEIALRKTRAGSADPNLNAYKQNVVWRYGQPNGPYTPFDISDELELRNRFLLNQNDSGARIDSRIERFGWTGSFIYHNIEVPIGSGGSSLTLDDWFKRANISADPNYYDYRHLATTYNMDRSINPRGIALNNGRMVNVNRIIGSNPTDVKNLYSAIYAGLADANFSGNRAQTAAQTAVNLIDYRDNDSNVTPYFNIVDGNTYYGFERPCIYISEIAYRSTGGVRSYAVELFKPYEEDNSPVGWRLVVGGATIYINDPNWNSEISYYVIRNQDSNNAPLPVSTGAIIKDTTLLTFFISGTTINLQRLAPDSTYITVDSMQIPAGFANGTNSYRRDISNTHKCIRRLWSGLLPGATTLGSTNIYTNPSTTLIQAHPANSYFIKNIGEIGMILRKSAYSQGPNPIGQTDTEITARLNLADPNFQKIFNYLTVLPPAEYVPDSNETRIKGRLNINTAPWYVLAQLPWVSQRKAGYNNPALAQAIVAYRDKGVVPGGDPNYSSRAGNPGFKSIGELNNIIRGSNSNYRMDYYALDTNDLTTFPDLTTPDHPLGGAADDFEERDVIFARISNLVTVRSDVFTAYILVRIGNDGPQKRVMAILDRSNVYSPGGKVKIVALHPVPDPR